ncbi:hypothetical protein LZ30DRAFT_739788 [Colletotrichum cereale]|nr:hypothetical protein LZ30DRAFT_739788 [Colletotrichum cereale]
MGNTTERFRDERSTLYKRAFPTVQWNAAREECISLSTTSQRVAYLARNFPGIVRIACLSTSGPIPSYVARVRQAFAKIIRQPHHSDMTGSDLGLTTVPPILLDGLLTRYATASSVIKLGELNDTASAIPKVHGGATVYFTTMMMPSRDGDVAAMHTDTLIIPDDDCDETYVTCTSVAYSNPMLRKERQAVMEGLQVSHLETAKSEGTLNSLLVGEDDDVWGSDMCTAFLRSENLHLTSVELLSQGRTPGVRDLLDDNTSSSLFQLRLAHSVRLSQEEHGALKRLQKMGCLSTSRGHMLVLGRGSSENSCLANCFYDIACVKDGFFPADQVFAHTIDSLLLALNERAESVYVAKEPGRYLRVSGFLDEQERAKYYKVTSKSAGKKLIEDAFRSKSLFNIYPGASNLSWANRYMTHGDELPEDVERFFTLVMEIFATYVEDWADSMSLDD